MVSGVVDWLERDAVPRATVRYHKFIMLMGKEPSKFLVPTLDIDLVWHTHQLFPHRYQRYGITNLGHIVNHDDGVEQGVLDDSFATTTKMWKRHYREQYGYQSTQSKWFRRSPASLYPPYASAAAANLATAVNRGATAGGCVTHDASHPPASRRSATDYPIGTPQTLVRTAGPRGTAGAFASRRARTAGLRGAPVLLVAGGCYSWGVACGGYGWGWGWG
ncbi:hypothetical protein HK405_002636, partial [Cladochytrium tenue]